MIERLPEGYWYKRSIGLPIHYTQVHMFFAAFNKFLFIAFIGVSDKVNSNSKTSSVS
jgi:hypothetical protein